MKVHPEKPALESTFCSALRMPHGERRWMKMTITGEKTTAKSVKLR